MPLFCSAQPHSHLLDELLGKRCPHTSELQSRKKALEASPGPRRHLGTLCGSISTSSMTSTAC